MTPVPLPASPCMRVRLIYNEGVAGEGGNRFYLSYSGSAPTGANCVTLAGDIAAAWETNIAPLIDEEYSLDEVDVLDIATDSGLSGQWTGSHAGTKTGDSLAASAATNVEFGIARRYRGGKPRMFLPPSTSPDLNGVTSWSETYVGDVNTGVAAFFTAIAGLSVGAIGTLAHVNLSYYKGFTNVTNPSGRERAVPTYRDSALLDTITGYSTKVIVGSQKRRRTSTTP
jgi:hypothetical protein